MKKHCVDLEKTGQFSPFFLDYLSGKEALKPFYSHPPREEGFDSAIQQKKFSVQQRQVLCEALQRQYQGVSPEPAVLENLKALNSEKTFTVTTGHQLNLFTGPLYVIYKLVSVINLAKVLQGRYPDYKIVPVYWMATEDHDVEEINHFRLDQQTYTWNTGQRGAVGEFDLDSSFATFLSGLPFVPKEFSDAYTQSKTLGEAVRKYMHALFGAQGLVVVDGNDPQLKASFSDVILADLLEHKAFHLAEQTGKKLEALGYGTQLFPREINLFYLEKGIRERIVRKGDHFEVLHTPLQFSESELKHLVKEHPERFSPNVVLRPLYQEMILPNLGYVGGPAEVIYWLQLFDLFKGFEVPFPVLLPRNFALVLPKGVQNKIEQLAWTREQVFQKLEPWKKEFLKNSASMDFSLVKEKEELKALYDRLSSQAQSLEGGLVKAMEAGKVRSLAILEQMGSKFRKAEERRLEVDLGRAKAVLEYVSPGGSPQERVLNLMNFSLENPHFIEDLMSSFDPLDFSMMILDLE